MFPGTREALCFDGQLPTTRFGIAGKVDLATATGLSKLPASISLNAAY